MAKTSMATNIEVNCPRCKLFFNQRPPIHIYRQGGSGFLSQLPGIPKENWLLVINFEALCESLTMALDYVAKASGSAASIREF